MIYSKYIYLQYTFPGKKSSILANGDLHIRDVVVQHAFVEFRCVIFNALTGEQKVSEAATIHVIGIIITLYIIKVHNNFQIPVLLVLSAVGH